jgi:hypothetical protein
LSARAEALADAFRLARQLRQSGWVVELLPEPQDRFAESPIAQNDARWRAQVQESGGEVRYFVSDTTSSSSAVLNAASEVVEWLQAAQG